VKRRLTKKLIADRERWWKTKAVELEKNMRRNNMERVFEILNLRKKTKVKIDAIRDKKGTLLKEEEEQLLRWKEYFEELLNVESEIKEEKEEKGAEWATDWDQDVCPKEEEVAKAIDSLKSFKAAGPDGIMAEVLKVMGQSGLCWMTKIISKIWEKNKQW
jgi:hypothetical protein